ncbi:MAG: guanylate kinase [Clostridia bacterium]|nr:guanylate kinase [Clostridia bacterium]
MKENNNLGKLFVVSGPSGAGKGTICKRIIEEIKEPKVELSISMATREPREGEIDGVHYFFTSKENFEEMIKAGGFLEYAKVYGNYYGTPKEKVVEKLSQGVDVILEIDIQGALNVKKAYEQAVLIFVVPPSMEVLRGRLEGRGTDSIETINMRLAETLKELTYMDQYDYVVVNDDLEEAVKGAKCIFQAEHLKSTDQINNIVKAYKEEN